VGRDDVYDDQPAVRDRIEEVSPAAVCFNSKSALERFAQRGITANVWRGDGARKYAQLGAITWAIDDSSGLCGHHDKRLASLRDLTKLLGRRR
jgi:hypothetical protein